MPNMNILIKPASGMCNMQCKYCFYEDEAKNREIESYGYMSEETLEMIIRKTLDYSETSCTIAYQGGEPTLRGIDFFEKSIEFQNKYKKKIKIENAIQTNGLLLNDEWAAFLKKNNFLVGISLDGTEFTHDSFRVDKKDNGTFKRVWNAIELLKKYEVDFNILTVVNKRTAKKVTQIYDFYKQNGFEYLQFIPCMNPLGDAEKVLPFTLTSKDYSQFLRTLFDLWYNDFKRGEYIHIQRFEGYLKILLNRHPEVCGMSGNCSRQYVIEADGEVYPCDFYVLDQYKLGNLVSSSFEEIDKLRREIEFIEESLSVPVDCKNCKYYGICRGGCKRYRRPKDYHCEAYYEFFEYSINRMQEMANYFRRSV